MKPVRIVLLCSLLVAVQWIASCSKRDRGEMPITTRSEVARKLFIKGRELYENLREEEAREYFNRALKEDMDFALCNFYLADMATSSVEFQTHMKMAVALAKNVSEGERLLIESLRAMAENNPEKAIELREKLVQLYPRDKRAWRFLGYLYRGRDEQKAIEAFKKAIEIDRNYAAAYNNLGYAYRRLGDYKNAVAAFKKYIRLLPDEPNPYDSIADLYTKMGEHEEAIKYYRKAVKLNKAFAFSERKIGENLIFLGRYDEARKALEEALSMEATPSGRINTYLLYAATYVYENRFDEALQATQKPIEYARAADLPEWQAETYLFHARIHLQRNQLDEARDALQQCKELLKSSELPRLTVDNLLNEVTVLEADAAARSGDLQRAFDIAEQLKERIALGKDPKQMEIYHRLMGYLYHRKGHPATAVAHFRQGAVNDPFTLYYWALCEEKLNEMEKAQELMQKAAHFNEHSLDYAFIRPLARAWLQKASFTQR